MYGVNASVPQNPRALSLLHYVADISDETTKNILLDVLDTPVSPELLPPDETAKLRRKRRIISALTSCTILTFITSFASALIRKNYPF
jgi:hypothetical protein